MPFITIGFDVDAVTMDAGISILMGFARYGELIPTFDGIVMLAVDVVALLFFSAYAAAVSRSIPPPSDMNSISVMIGFIIEF